jgi:hypothetical protein
MARKARATVREAADMAREALLLNAKKISASDDRLGDLTLYDLTPGWRKPVAEVVAAFARHGLDPGHVLPCAPDWMVSFGRALEQVGASIRGADFELKNASKGKNGERRVAIVEIARNGRVTTKDLGTVVCPAASDGGAPFIEREDDRGYARAVVAAAREFHEVYTLDDVRTAVVQHIDRWYGLPLRRQPPYVAYWVPAAGSLEIEKLRAAVEELGAGQIEMMTGYASDQKSQRMAVNTVNKGLEGQLTDFKAEVDAFVKKDPGSTRVSTIEELVVQAKILRERAILYKDILGGQVVSVEAQYKAVEKTLKKHLGIVEDAHAEVAS